MVAVAGRIDVDPTTKVHILPYAALPQPIREDAERMGDPETYKAVMWHGDVYLVEDRFTSEAEVEQAIFHELYHKWVGGLLGDRMQDELNALFASLGGRDALLKLADKYQWTSARGILKDYSARTDMTHREKTAAIVNELLAEAGARNRLTIQWKIREFIGAVRNWLRKHGFLELAKSTESDLAYLLQRASAASGQHNGQAPYFQRAAPAPTFYSQVERVLAQKMPNRANFEQIKGILSPQNGVKPDELKWIGLDDFLKTKDYFTKEEVLEFVSQHQVQVREVMRGERRTLTPDEQAERTNLGLRGRLTEEEKARYDELSTAELGSPPTFSQWQLPGGSNYKELLLTLPIPPSMTMEEYFTPGRIVKSYIGQDKVLKFHPHTGPAGWAVEVIAVKPDGSPMPGARPRIHFTMPDPSKLQTAPTFNSGHFNEPNVLAHVRMNDRTTADGKKVLFIEEIQSDWHQKGRREGYHNRAVAYGVPDAPFRKTWHELVLKRMLRYAAEHGYDSLAWTTGVQQRERYDLSKQIDSLQWDRGKAPDTTRVAAFKNDQEILSRQVQDRELDATVGKDLAKKIIDAKAAGQTSGEYSGLDLKVGGEGMKGFYDDIIPAYLNKIGKKWGAKVGMIDLGGVNMDAVPTFNKDTGKEVFPTLEVHSLPITDAMTRSVLTEGQALFENTPQYAVREGEQRELAYRTAKDALGDLDRAAQTVSGLAGTLGRPGLAGAGIRTTGLGFTRALIREGRIDLRGHPIRTVVDLARLAQIYRDPRFETFRIFYVNDQKQIVGQEGFSSRLPSAVAVFVINDSAMAQLRTMEAAGYSLEDRMKAASGPALEPIRHRMRRLGATGYYLLHNHPSGNAKPSIEDQRLTMLIAQEVQGFLGHVVIDSKAFGLIAKSEEGRAVGETTVVPLDLGPDALLTPEIPHDLLGISISNPEQMASVAKQLQVPHRYVTIAYLAGPGGAIRAIQEVPVGLFANYQEMQRYLDGRFSEFGATVAVSFYSSLNSGPVNLAASRLIEAGYLFDHANAAPYGPQLMAGDELIRESASARRIRQSRQSVSRAVRVEETAPHYGTRPSDMRMDDEGAIDPPTVREKLTAAGHAMRPSLLAAHTLDQLAQVYGREQPEVNRYNRAAQTMEADFVELTREADPILRAWSDLKTSVADRMARVMEEARVAQYDPDPQPSKDRRGAAVAPTTAAERSLRERFQQLPEEAKTIYRHARDFYTSLADRRFEAIRDRIQRSDGTPENRKALLDRLHLVYEQLKAKVYFPFTRFGEHLVIAKQMQEGQEIDRNVQAFASPLEAQRFSTLMKGRGWQVKQTTAKDYAASKDIGTSTAMRDMLDIVDDLEIEEDLFGPNVTSLKDQLKHAIDQLALQSLPDMSYAKHFIHAKEVPGWSKDALRAFAHSALHGAHHLSRIRNADRMTKALLDFNARIDETETGDTTEARQVYNELVQRHEQILNPTTHPIAAWLGQLGFTMSLGGVVATGLTNMTQVPLITFPWLGARYGFTRSSFELARAYKDFLDPKTLNAESLFDASQSTTLPERERAMLNELQRRGRIDLTQTMDLAGRSAQDNLSRVAKQYGTVQEKVLRLLGFTFHAPEVMNRQVTALATYRMERAKPGAGETAEQQEQRAIAAADRAIVETHFIYEAFNRARIMQGNVMRVLTMFKQYPQHIAFLYGRAAAVWLDRNGATTEERTIAKRQLLSMLSVQLGAAGVLGMPFLGSVASLFAAALQGFGDDDEQWDWEVELRQHLADRAGKWPAEILSHGISRLTPWDMAARLGQDDLFFRAPAREREGRAAAMDWATSIMGPVAGYAVNAFLGTEDLAKGIRTANAGHFLRGVEELTPAVIRHGVRTLRYALEGGIRTRDQYKQLDLNGYEKLGQFFGFAPARAAEMYESVTAEKNREHRIEQRKRELLDSFAAATQERDAEARRTVLAEIQAFNRRHRGEFEPITGDTLAKSLRGRQQHERGMREGLSFSQRRQGLREEGRFANL